MWQHVKIDSTILCAVYLMNRAVLCELCTFMHYAHVNYLFC